MNLESKIPIQIYSHPLRQLSHSGLQTFHTCPRKFELDRIGTYQRGSAVEGIKRIETAHTGYGSAFGAGIQAMLTGYSLGQSLVEAIKNYRYPEIYPDGLSDSTFEKSLFHCLDSLKHFYHTELKEISNEWEVLEFNGKPATELAFAIKLPNGFYYRGYIDAVLRHMTTKQILVLELKTEGGYPNKSDEVNEAKYKYSPQGTAYALVADWVAEQAGLANDISVTYIIHRTKVKTFEARQFRKDPEIRIRFLEDLVSEMEYIEHLIGKNKSFPMYGNCNSYFQVCQYYGICGVDKFDFTSISDTPIGDYENIIPLDDLLSLQYKRIKDAFEDL